MQPDKQISLQEPGFRDIQISLFENCKTTVSTAISIDAIFHRIRTGEGFKSLIQQIRATNDTNKKGSLKKQLPGVTISGLFDRGRKRENLICYSGLMGIDADKVENISELRAKLEKDKYVFAVFLSPSGTGVKIIVKVLNDLSKHLQCFLDLEKHFFTNYSLQIDKSCKDIPRLIFLSWDETLFVNENSKQFTPENSFEEKTFDNVFDELNKTNEFKTGGRNNFLFKLACNCRDYGFKKVFTEKNCLEKFVDNDFPADEIKTIVNSAFSYPVDMSKSKIIDKKVNSEKVFSKIKQVEKYINSTYELRNNEVSCKIEFRKKGTQDFFKELNENNIFRDLSHNNLDYSLNKLKSLLNSDFVPVFNPFKNYFEKLKKWDSQTEINIIEKLTFFIPVKNPERFKKHFKKMLVRCIACALEDSFFNKQAFIFVHDQQNSGKTTFCRWLCPPELKDYMTENINTDKDSQIALATNFLINMDELATLSKVEINALKSFLSKDNINVRLPYESRATIKPRRANFIGSTNKDEFLNDETGSVRWLCFELTGKLNFNYKNEIDINDVWRQAYALYKEGFQYQLTQTEIEENEMVNKQYLVNTPEMDLIPRYFKPGTKEGHDIFLTATDILKEISTQNLHLRSNIYAVGKALKNLGYPKSTNYSDTTKLSVKGYYVFKA